MGCASSAPFMGESGPLGEIKEVANNMVESGEHALHDFGEAAGKTIHEAVDHVKEAVSTATHGIQDAVGNISGAAEKKVTTVSDDVKKEADNLLNMAAPQSNGTRPDACRRIPLKSITSETEDMAKTMDEIMNTPPQSPATDMAEPPKEMFRPTPAPSFDASLTPNTTVVSIPDMLEKQMEKIDEVANNESVDQMADRLIQETESVAQDAQEMAASLAEEAEMSENPTELDSDPPLTKWEALADVMVELPPRTSIDLGTGQLYAIVEDESVSKHKFYKSVMKEMSAETHAAL